MATPNITKAVDNAADDIAAQIAAIRNDLAQLTEAMGTYGRAKSAEIGTRAAQGASDLRVRGKKEAARVEAGIEETLAMTEDFVARQPATALGIAAGIGFILGLWSARR